MNNRRGFLKTACLAVAAIPFVSILGNENKSDTNREEYCDVFIIYEKRCQEINEYNKTNFPADHRYSNRSDESLIKDMVDKLKKYNNDPMVIIFNRNIKKDIIPILIPSLTKSELNSNRCVYNNFLFPENRILNTYIYFLDSIPKNTIYCLPEKYFVLSRNLSEMEFGTLTTYIRYE